MKNLTLYKFAYESTINDNTLQLSPITLNKDYRKKWNIYEKDFVCLTKNGQLISNSILYRVGGFDGDIKQDYFMLLKYVEAIYEINFLKKCYPNKSNKELELQRKHLEGHWCIFDKNGIEKVEFPQFKTPYLVNNNSCIYSIDGDYYNIETGEHYGHSYTSIKSKEFLFLENNYDKDKSKCGVMKINKKDGTWELFI